MFGLQFSDSGEFAAPTAEAPSVTETYFVSTKPNVESYSLLFTCSAFHSVF